MEMSEKLAKKRDRVASDENENRHYGMDIAYRNGFDACYKELEQFINLAKDFKRKYQCHKNCDCTACVALKKVGIEWKYLADHVRNLPSIHRAYAEIADRLTVRSVKSLKLGTT
jgi:hypothetical protein